MDKSSFKLVGAACGQHGQYTFYKALRLSRCKQERVLAIGDFFFVRIWPDSELVAVGELQLLWKDCVADQTLVSLRLYFLPENTPNGRNSHGQDEVLALNEKVVVRAEDLLSWIYEGSSWRSGLRAVWRGDCVPLVDPPPSPSPPTSPLHQTKLDFSDVDKEKSTIEEKPDSPGVVVFTYPHYCRYRALLARLEGMQNTWLRHSLVAALGGYAAETSNTVILFCKDTFEYPELEGHEFVCNHLAPRLKGRPRGRSKPTPRSCSRSPDSRSSDSEHTPAALTPNETQVFPRRLSLRNGAAGKANGQAERGPLPPRHAPPAPLTPPTPPAHAAVERAFLAQLRSFYREKGEDLGITHALKHISLRAVFEVVASKGGYEAVSKNKLWRAVHPDRPARVRRLYERFLLPYEAHLRRVRANGAVVDQPPILPQSPPRPLTDNTNKCKEEVKCEESSLTAEELNREFLESLDKEEKPSISVKPPQLLVESAQTTLLNEKAKRQSSNALNRLSSSDDKHTVSGHTPNRGELRRQRPVGRSSLRAVRVKPIRSPCTTTSTPPPAPAPPAAASVRAEDASSSPPAPAPPLTNFGINPPPDRPANPANSSPHSDDDIVEVPYKPATPEIIDLDEYPESPQSPKKKKLDILKERGLEVTALLPAVPKLMLNPAIQHQIMTQASLFPMYNIMPQNYSNGVPPPKVIQSSCVYGNIGPEKTVYGNPNDPFMPPPHTPQGAPIKSQRAVTTDKVDDAVKGILDLTCKTISTPPSQKLAVETVRESPSKMTLAQNLSKNFTLLDGKAVIGSNLEITLVNPKNQTPPKNRQPQKRSSTGQFMSTKTPTPPKKHPKSYPSPSEAKLSPTIKNNPINIPTYRISKDDVSPTSSTGSRDSQQNSHLQNEFKSQNNLARKMEMPKNQLPNMPKNNILNSSHMMDLQNAQNLQKSVSLSPFIDPMYMSAIYNSIAGQMDQRQLAMYRDLMASQFRYSGLLGATPTTKN